MKFLFTGDLVVNQAYSAEENISPELLELFKKSDCNIVNLEAPVTNSNSKILKTGPHLKAHKESTLDVLKTLNIHVAALANNHIKDYDEQGVLDTIDFCHAHGFKTMGAGRNLKEASETFVLNTPEGSIAIINIAENEWASAERDSAGANGMNLIKDTRKIQQAKKEYDFVFVVVHGGHEYYNLPSPRMQDQYRFYAEQGADLVVGHHTHCVSGHEVYQGTPIFYSLGNFLFTKDSAYEDWYIGLMLKVEIENGGLTTELIPVTQEKESFRLSLCNKELSKKTLDRVANYSEIIASADEVERAWQEFTEKRYKGYLSYWSAKAFIKNKYIKAVLNKLNIPLTTIGSLTYYLNLMRCEAHLDLSKSVINKRLNK